MVPLDLSSFIFYFLPGKPPDVRNAGQAGINKQGGIVKNSHIFGEYKGVKIEVRLDSSSGIINTIHPSWEK